MKTKLFFLIFILQAFSPVYAQLNELWTLRYSGIPTGIDEVRGMVIDNAGNVYLTGRSQGSGLNNNFDFATLKITPSGDTAWVERYDGGGSGLPVDEANDIAVDALGNVYVTGFSTGMDMTSDILTIKYSSNGDTVWVKRYSFTNGSNDIGNSIAVDESGNVYVTGGSGGDYVTLMYDAAGIFQWASRYNGPGNDSDSGLKILYHSGNLYVTGISRNTFNSSTSVDWVTIKYNIAGDSVWVKRYNGPGNNYDEPNAMELDPLGNLCITGFSRNTAAASSADYLTIKYNSNGDSVWVRRYDGTASNQDEANDIAIDQNGNVFITGTSTGTGTFSDYTTIMYDSSGSQQWLANYHGPLNLSNDYAHSISLDGNGNAYVTGGSVQSGTSTDIVTIKYTPAGSQQWIKSYAGPGNGGDVGYFIEAYDNDFVYVSGNSSGGASGLDYIAIKYEKTTSINHITGNFPRDFKLHQNYPNPFNPSTSIGFDIPRQGNVNLSIYDMLGRKIAQLINEDLNAGSYEYNWNAAGLPGGVYFYSLRFNNAVEIRKLVLSK